MNQAPSACTVDLETEARLAGYLRILRSDGPWEIEIDLDDLELLRAQFFERPPRLNGSAKKKMPAPEE